MRHATKPIHCVQFHPEVAHTPRGGEIIANFLFRVCHAEPSWTPGAFVDERGGEDPSSSSATSRVICGLSGGVDSSVAAALVHRAIGDQLTCVFVDTGLLRLHEREQVERTFRANLGIKLVTVDASRRFPRRAGGRRRSGGEADDHRPHVHRRVRGSDERRGEGRRLPRAGNALSRRDRVVLAARRPVGDDQDAPQRRRPQART